MPTEREEQANERRAGGRRRVEETTWDPDPDSATTQPDPLPTQPRLLCRGGPQRGESPCWAHRCWDARSACSRLCNALPFSGVALPCAFQKPVFYLSCLSGLGKKRRGLQDSPGPGQAPGSQAADKASPASSFHTSTPAVRVLHQQELPPTERGEEERSGAGQHAFLYKLASSEVFKHLKAFFRPKRNQVPPRHKGCALEL